MPPVTVNFHADGTAMDASWKGLTVYALFNRKVKFSMWEKGKTQMSRCLLFVKIRHFVQKVIPAKC